MQIGLILLILAFPLLELAVLIKVGQWLGLWWTILLLIATGIAGGLIVNAQGMSAARRAAQSMQEGRPPLEPVVDSMMLMLAGTLLLIPGLISDAIAVALLIPPLRHAIARWGLSRLFANAEVHVERREWRSPGRADDGGAGRRDEPGRRSGNVIEGEWERVDEPKSPAKPGPDAKPPRD